MTLETESNVINHEGDGTTTVFPYDFRVDNADDMNVYQDSIEYPTGWTIDGLGNPSGGNVTFDTPPANQVRVTLMRVVPYTQTVDYRPFDPFPAETHENALDKLTMQTQQLGEESGRNIQAPPGADPEVDYTLPPYDGGKGLMWAEDDKVLTNTDDNINDIVSDARDEANAAAASAAAAATSEGNAATSASDAATSASNAATSETNAANSAIEAQNAIPTISEDEPSGGVDGEVWYQYTPGGTSVPPAGVCVLLASTEPTPDGWMDSTAPSLTSAAPTGYRYIEKV